MNWLQQIPYPMLIAVAIVMALAPFYPEPHLWEKLKMLRHGTLKRPIDIFDLCWHLTPMLLIVIKVWLGYPSAST